MIDETHIKQVQSGERFEFGKNWKNYLYKFSDEDLLDAQDSQKRSPGVGTLQGKRFLVVESDGGLFSLAARDLNADVCSFDF